MARRKIIEWQPHTRRKKRGRRPPEKVGPNTSK